MSPWLLSHSSEYIVPFCFCSIKQVICEDVYQPELCTCFWYPVSLTWVPLSPLVSRHTSVEVHCTSSEVPEERDKKPLTYHWKKLMLPQQDTSPLEESYLKWFPNISKLFILFGQVFVAVYKCGQFFGQRFSTWLQCWNGRLCVWKQNTM